MEISIKNVFEWIYKGIVFILVITVLFGAVAFAYSKYVITPTYRSSVKLCANSADSDSQLINYYKAVAPQYIELLNVTEFYRMVADKALEITGDVYNEREIAGAASFSSVVEDTGIFYVTVTSSDPTAAYNIARAIAETAPDRITALKPSDELLVASYPVLSSAPFAPDVTKNTMVGMIFGFALSVCIVIVKELLDNRIKSTDQITEIYGLPILGTVPTFSGTVKKGDM